MVGAELNFVTLLGTAVGHCHDSGVVHEEVEAGFFFEEGFGEGGNGGEAHEVEMEVVEVGVGERLLDVIDRGKLGGLLAREMKRVERSNGYIQPWTQCEMPCRPFHRLCKEQRLTPFRDRCYHR